MNDHRPSKSAASSLTSLVYNSEPVNHQCTGIAAEPSGDEAEEAQRLFTRKLACIEAAANRYSSWRGALE
eukprot:3866232-Pleurochrysis_carterae.AAC.1